MTDRLLANFELTGLFSGLNKSKTIALRFLIISLFGARGKNDERLSYRAALGYIITGIVTYFISYLIFGFRLHFEAMTIAYVAITTIGFILVLTGGSLLSRVIRQRLNRNDIFNKENETFPQEEILLENEYSIHLPAEYSLKGRRRKSWINIINPFRGLLVLGSPGSGKPYFVIRHIITQHIRKGFSMFIYDFKFDDLSKISYNHFLVHRYLYPVPPKFYVINFDDLSRTHRCNPLHPET